jgi:membrane protease YdiL (CAAX protease family)
MSGISFGLSTLLFLYTLVGEPLLGILYYQNLSEKLKSDPSARVPYYLRLIVWEWAWVVAIVVILLGVQHPLVSIGLQEPNQTGVWVTIGGIIGLAAATALSFILPPFRKVIQEQMAGAAQLLPINGRERWLFAAVSMTAGVCEELLYRGFGIFYLTILFPWLPVPVILAAAGLLFGLGHAYQGKKAILITALVGTAFAVLYWVSGSLLPGMILHALIDLRTLFFWPPKDPA